jgi:hypothetical protein
MKTLAVSEWAKRLGVTPRAIYKKLTVRGLRTIGSRKGPMMVTENRIRLAFPGRLEAVAGENRLLTEFVEKLETILEVQEAHDEALKVLLRRTEKL